MEARGVRVYCAGPLFNAKEREEMELLAGALERAGFETFLPQRDGLELTKCVDELVQRGMAPGEARRIMAEAIFALDVYQVLHGCDVLVANLNGRVPDEGTVSEAAIAWSRGKAVVGYKSDTRTAFAGQDNPLVVGLFEFSLCTSPEEVAAAVKTKLGETAGPAARQEVREQEISERIRLGREIWRVLREDRSVDGVLQVLMAREPEAAGKAAGAE